MELLQQPGWIEVICGSMFSGKSEELIRRVRRTQYAKQNILVFKPEIDDRYSANDVVSHNGTSAFALSINKASEILEKVTSEVDVIAIDEGNFFDEEIVAVAQILADRGHRVIIAGLDQDFRGEPFPQMASLIALAEFVTKFQAICSVCGSPASRTQRIVNGKPADYYDPIILIGATEAYEARCRHHHIVENKPISNNFDCNEKAPRL